MAVKEPAKARTLLELAITHQEAALKIVRHRFYREHLCAHYVNLANVLADLQIPGSELERAHERGVELARELARDFPDVAAYQSQLGGALSNWAVLRKKEGQFAAARRLLEEAIVHQQLALKDNNQNPTYLDFLRKHYDVLAQVLRELKGPDLERTYRDMIPVMQRLLKLFPKNAYYPSSLGMIKNDLGTTHLHRGEAAEARRLFEEAISHQQAALALKKSQPRYRKFLGNHYKNLAGTLMILKQPAQAEKAYRACLAVRELLTEEFPDDEELATELVNTYHELGNLLSDTGRGAEAEKAYRAAVARLQGLASRHAKKPWYQSGVGAAQHNLAIQLAQGGELAKARDMFREAVRSQSLAHQADPTNRDYRKALLGHYQHLCVTLLKLGDHALLAEAAEERVAVSPEDWHEHYRAAQFLRRCAELVKKRP
jgi:tetratricopeptide (TPR) repeat protein